MRGVSEREAREQEGPGRRRMEESVLGKKTGSLGISGIS